jgi:hypothetical protein
MIQQQTTWRHVWLAGLGVLGRVWGGMARIAGRLPAEPVHAEAPVAFGITYKPAKRVRRPAVSSASRRAGERESQRRIAGKGRQAG